MEFNVGDKVRYIGNVPTTFITQNKIYEIYKKDLPNKNHIIVYWIVGDDGVLHWTYLGKEHFELVDDEINYLELLRGF
jgi:hypothetical protein